AVSQRSLAIAFARSTVAWVVIACVPASSAAVAGGAACAVPTPKVPRRIAAPSSEPTFRPLMYVPLTLDPGRTDLARETNWTPEFRSTQQSVEDAQRHNQRYDAKCERDERGEEADDHPAAWSSRVTENGVAPGGSTASVRPQRPTITSAGASRS